MRAKEKEVNTNLLVNKKGTEYKKEVDLPIITVLWNRKHQRQILMISWAFVFNFCGF